MISEIEKVGQRIMSLALMLPRPDRSSHRRFSLLISRKLPKRSFHTSRELFAQAIPGKFTERDVLHRVDYERT